MPSTDAANAVTRTEGPWQVHVATTPAVLYTRAYGRRVGLLKL
jgi:hypothetical protein